MNRHPVVLLGRSVFFVVAVLAGCAAEPNAKAVSQSSVLTLHYASSRDAGYLAFAYRHQAEVLRDLASRLEVEAALSQEQLGANDERSRQSREAANAVWAAAEEADEIARSYQQQLAHGRVN
jgi:sugar phosphate isomerase/epimerase